MQSYGATKTTMLKKKKEYKNKALNAPQATAGLLPLTYPPLYIDRV